MEAEAWRTGARLSTVNCCGHLLAQLAQRYSEVPRGERVPRVDVLITSRTEHCIVVFTVDSGRSFLADLTERRSSGSWCSSHADERINTVCEV